MINCRWYVLHAYSGYEKKVSESILDQAQKLGISEHIEEVSVPTQNIVEVKRGVRINTERIILYIWFIGGILAATSGILISMQQAIITPVMGWKILIPLFAAVIVGGIGNPIGALMGGLLIGITGEIATGWINPSYKPAVYFLVLLIVLLLRPNGILGLKGRQF